MKPGTLGWLDLTVANASEVRDFYASVVGWTPQPVSMGDYDDFNMCMDGSPVAGVCHARGSNQGLPSVWMAYWVVADLAAALAHVETKGGKIVRPAKSMGAMGSFAVIADPAGAVCALFQPPT
jgi:predicted enzyme related to lactoylglutathione lyase